jgi:hypothetical protein
MAATTTLLSLVTPTQGTLSGTWGDTVNYGITDYIDIAIAGTLSFTGDGAITLANTIGSASGNAITTTTAQYMVIRVTGTLTTPKIITGPSYSKLYMVDNAATGSTVTFKAAGQTGISVAVGEKCFAYYNGTDYVKVASSVAGVTSFTAGTTGLTPNTATTGAVTLAGTLAPDNGGTGVSNNAAMTVTGSGNFAYTRTLTGATNVTFPTTGTLATLAGSETLTNKTIAYGSNTLTDVVGVTATQTLTNKTLTSPTFTAPVLGTPASGNLSLCTADGTNAVGYLNIPQNVQTGSYTLVLGDSGDHIFRSTGGAATWTIPAASSVAYPIGTALTFINLSSTAVTIAITTDTMYLSSAGTTGSRTLAQYGSATAIKVAGVSSSGIWVISGSGLT